MQKTKCIQVTDNKSEETLYEEHMITEAQLCYRTITFNLTPPITAYQDWAAHGQNTFE